LKNLARNLFSDLREKVFSAQVGKVHRLKGKHVVRDGVTFWVKSVDWRRGKVVVSDVKTPLKRTTTFSIRSFLSKAVEVLEPKRKEKRK